MSTDYARIAGQRLRFIRELHGLALSDMEAMSRGAFKAGLLGTYERADRTLTVERAEGICDLLGIPVLALYACPEGNVLFAEAVARIRTGADETGA